MKQDILTVSRVMRILTSVGIDGCRLNLQNPIDAATLISSLSQKEILDNVINIIHLREEEKSPQLVMEFFINLSEQLNLFNDEIDRRKQHVVSLGIYQDDTEEELLAKQEKNKDLYIGDMYLSNYFLLKKNNIEPACLSIYESMILIEEIVCSEINKVTLEMLGLMDSDSHSFCEQVRKTIAHANFYSFALDIYDDVNEMYQSLERKRSNK
ncbi:MAG: hypothetical protein RBT65_17570 [Methanolobus sp.]|nr:hypothetical protein [Methanolobus sp.]